MTWRLSDLAPAISTLLVLGALWYVAVVDQPVRIVVEHGTIRMEPTYVRLRVTVEPDERNRELWVGLWEPGWQEPTQGSYEQLEGERSRRTRIVIFPNVWAGDYDAIAVVERSDGTTDEARATLKVIPRF